MEFGDIEVSRDLEVTVREGDEHRLCAECRAECEPEPGGADGHGVRIMYVCGDHGLQSVVDPFEQLR